MRRRTRAAFRATEARLDEMASKGNGDVDEQGYALAAMTVSPGPEGSSIMTRSRSATNSGNSLTIRKGSGSPVHDPKIDSLLLCNASNGVIQRGNHRDKQVKREALPQSRCSVTWWWRTTKLVVISFWLLALIIVLVIRPFWFRRVLIRASRPPLWLRKLLVTERSLSLELELEQAYHWDLADLFAETLLIPTKFYPIIQFGLCRAWSLTYDRTLHWKLYHPPHHHRFYRDEDWISAQISEGAEIQRKFFCEAWKLEDQLSIPFASGVRIRISRLFFSLGGIRHCPSCGIIALETEFEENSVEYLNETVEDIPRFDNAALSLLRSLDKIIAHAKPPLLPLSLPYPEDAPPTLLQLILEKVSPRQSTRESETQLKAQQDQFEKGRQKAYEDFIWPFRSLRDEVVLFRKNLESAKAALIAKSSAISKSIGTYRVVHGISNTHDLRKFELLNKWAKQERDNWVYILEPCGQTGCR